MIGDRPSHAIYLHFATAAERDGCWGDGSAVERRGFGCPLRSLRTAEGGKSGVRENPMGEYGLFQPLNWLLLIAIILVAVVPFWQIFKKAGFSPWLSLLMPIPIVGLVALFYLAFAKWPQNPG